MWIRVHRHTLVSSTDCQCLILETNFIIQAGIHAALALRILLAKDVISSCLLFCEKLNKQITPLFFSDNFSCFVLLSHTCSGKRSGRIYVVDTKTNPREPSLHRVVEPAEVLEKTGLAYPHQPHCLASGDVLVSCLGDKDGNAQGSGFLLLDSEFNIKGR